MEAMKMAFIGGGAMGEAILAAVLNRGLSTPQTIWVSDVKDERRQHLKKTYQVSVTGSNHEAAAEGDIIIFAIKPQSLPEIMPDLKGAIRPGQLVLSIIAGVRIDTLCKDLDHRQLVRVIEWLR